MNLRHWWMLSAALLISCGDPDPSEVDEDLDGFTLDVDCNDADRSINPEAVELCDGVDQNCNDIVDDEASNALQFFTDADSDGFGDPDAAVSACEQPSDAVVDNSDCDDSDAAVNPDAIEVCNAVDDNCDEVINEAGAEGELEFWPDADGDTFGDLDADAVLACEAPEGHVAENTDCDDEVAEVNTTAVEICNEVDDDCNELVDDDTTDQSDCYLSTCRTLIADDPSLVSGVYSIDPDGLGPKAARDVYCDMDFAGGGWTLLLAYSHTPDDNLITQKNTIPTDPEDGDSHAYGTNLDYPSDEFSEVRFFCESSGHTRKMHFSTTLGPVVQAAHTGELNLPTPAAWSIGNTIYSDHGANLPESADKSNSAGSGQAFTRFPLYGGNPVGHWNIGEGTGDFECDDNTTVNTSEDQTTLHQVWAR